jgi:putative addiction module killer protein
MVIESFEVEIYRDKLYKQPFIEWLESLKDLRAIAKIQARITRLRLGNYGDYKSLGQGLYVTARFRKHLGLQSAI